MASLLDVINEESCASFLMDDATRTIVIICTIHSTKDISIVWKGPDWESFLLGLLNVRAMFKIVAYICNRESFKSLLTIVCKSTFVTKIWFEFGQYMARLAKVLSSLMMLQNILMFRFVYLFPCKIGTNVCAKILGNKKMLTLMECMDSFFSEDQELYWQEVFPETIFQILQVVILSGMVCLSIFSGGILLYVFLVSPRHGSWFFSWNIFFCKNSFH
jgi:hypothetical protein